MATVASHALKKYVTGAPSPRTARRSAQAGLRTFDTPNAPSSHHMPDGRPAWNQNLGGPQGRAIPLQRQPGEPVRAQSVKQPVDGSEQEQK